MDKFKELFDSDIARYGNNKVDHWTYKFLYYYRRVSTCNNRLLLYYYRFRYREVCSKHGFEIERHVKIGKGLYIGHPYNITINGTAILGNNINLHKGVTIGQENRGRRKGAPIIGNRVWIGINSTIVGKISIGDDVLVAPNSYVNCDIPAHSIVIGNPCRIICKENATENYINNIV
ncbi:MAG: serine acetyltransferase [Clostridiales bacterium]|nr:serine acetyltransferase [Clostridiales bacterium]